LTALATAATRAGSAATTSASATTGSSTATGTGSAAAPLGNKLRLLIVSEFQLGLDFWASEQSGQAIAAHTTALTAETTTAAATLGRSNGYGADKREHK